MHYIQNKILYTLSFTDSARYSQLRPKEIESNHFIYHLKQLMLDKFVVKNTDGTYSLSTIGKSHVDRWSLATKSPRSQPKIVNLIACKNKEGEYLLYRRRRQPFIGLVGFPYGKIHLGETIKESSERELAEKTNLKAKLTHRGDVYVTIFDGSELLTHMLFHIHSGKVLAGALKPDSNIGTCFWSRVDLNKPKQYFPGFIEIYKKIRANPKNRFFEEYTFKL